MIRYPTGYNGPKLEDIRQETRDFVSSRFLDEQGKPLILTDGQCDIFSVIAYRLWPRVHIQTFTRYGKSNTISIAVDSRISARPEKFSIVAGTDDQAKIIQGYAIDHIFDSPEMARNFDTHGESVENIRRYKNKDRINFVVKRGDKTKGEKDLLGESFVTNAKGAMGHGAPNVILDEGALVSDEEEAKVFRMTGDQPDNFYCKVGNPFESGHFRKSFNDPNYLLINIDYKQGIKEGRITFEQVEEARQKPFFGILYECKFPKLGTMDDKGWTVLLTEEQVDAALTTEYVPFGINKLGADVAGGGKNFSVEVARHINVAKMLFKNSSDDTMDLAEDILGKRKSRFAGMDGTFIDNTGMGRGVADILRRQIKHIIPFDGADAPEKETQEAEEFFNIRAMCYWRARAWILAGGKLYVPPELEGEERKEWLRANWYQLTTIRYKQSMEKMRGKMIMMSKEDMAKLGLPSPDVADGLMMTFLTADVPLQSDSEGIREDQDFKNKLDKYHLFPK